MRRILVGLLIGALIFGVSFAGAKVATVTNPMQTDLHAGNHNISWVDHIRTNGLSVDQGIVYLDYNHNRPSVRWVNQDPRTDPRAVDAQPGSLALAFIYNDSALWVKTGPFPADWQRVALEP